MRYKQKLWESPQVDIKEGDPFYAFKDGFVENVADEKSKHSGWVERAEAEKSKIKAWKSVPASFVFYSPKRSILGLFAWIFVEWEYLVRECRYKKIAGRGNAKQRSK